jgi:hypothetical protein
MNFRFLSAALVAVLAMSAGVVQAKQKVQSVVNAQNKSQFETQADGIRAQMRSGGRYQFVNERERATVERRLDQMAKLLDAHADGSVMSEKEKVELLNAQEEVNGILTQRDGKRLICSNRAPTGSHLPKNTCRTYADQERERRETRDALTGNDSVTRNARDGT